jgi:hypothetical protein
MPKIDNNKISEQDNIYYNIIFNHRPEDLDAPSKAEYNTTNTLIILDNPNDYYCSVIRFVIPLDNIPLFIFPIVPNQGNPNLSTLVVGISYNNNNYFQNIIYSPDNNFAPPIQNQLQQVITPYYYVYSYQNLITAINTALLAQFNIFVAANPGAPQAGNPAPYFYYNSSTQLITLVTHQSWATTGPTQALIYMNNSLATFLDAFQTFFYGYNQLNDKDYSFNITNNGNNLSGSNLSFTQEYNVINYWSSLRKIVITTLSIPIISEYIPSQNNNNTNQLPIITDFIPIISNAGENRSIAYYNPTSQYRLVNMISSSSLKKIDMYLYWQDLSGNLYPIYISRNQQASVKLAFFRKSLYKKLNL